MLRILGILTVTYEWWQVQVPDQTGKEIANLLHKTTMVAPGLQGHMDQLLSWWNENGNKAIRYNVVICDK